MKKNLTILTIILLTLMASACRVQAQYAQKGVTEFGGTVSFSSTTSVSNGTSADNATSLLQIMPYVNYFITNGLSIGLSPAIYSFKSAGASDATTSFAAFFVPGYTFATQGSVYPYIEGLIGYNTLKTGSSSGLSGLSYGGKGGLKMAVGKSGLFNAGVSYMLITLNPENADKRNGFNNLAVGLGFSVYLN